MKKFFAFLLSAVIIIGLIGCQSNGDKKSQPDKDNTGETTLANDGSEAAKLYKQKCANCHGGNLEGSIGPKLNTIGTDMSKQEIEKVIIEGAPAMPSGLLVGDQAVHVAEWLTQFK